MGVCLSFTTKGKLIRQMQKIKTTTTTNKVLFKCCGTWENDRFPSQRPSPPSGMEKSPAMLSKAKQKPVFRNCALF